MRRALPVVCLALALAWSACTSRAPAEPPVATPSVSLNHQRAPLGSPIELKYRFVVAEKLARFDREYRVMVHFVDADDELMWTDDHNPPIPTTKWIPGQTIEYTRTMFIPIYPYIGEATVQMGLYSTPDNKRLPLSGKDTGQRAYAVSTLQLLPQTENVFLIYKEGWHPAEVADDNAAVEWQWSKKEATLAFRNPKRNALAYLDLDGQPMMFPTPQTATVQLGSQTVDSFTVSTSEQIIRKIPLTAAQLGTSDMVELKLLVDKTFVPALVDSKSRDPRELGIRVFHAFIEVQ